MLREIKGSKRLPRALFFRVDGTGAASILEGAFDATLVDNGVGDWTLTFARPFGRTPVVALAALTADSILQIHTVNNTTLRVKAFAAHDGVTAQDVDFHAAVYGSDAANETD